MPCRTEAETKIWKKEARSLVSSSKNLSFTCAQRNATQPTPYPSPAPHPRPGQRAPQRKREANKEGNKTS